MKTSGTRCLAASFSRYFSVPSRRHSVLGNNLGPSQYLQVGATPSSDDLAIPLESSHYFLKRRSISPIQLTEHPRPRCLWRHGVHRSLLRLLFVVLHFGVDVPNVVLG